MKITKNIQWLTFGVMALMSCQSYDQSAHFWLVNHSDHAVYYWLTCDSSYRNLVLNKDYRLKAGDSIQPYLLYGPEGEGDSANKWINAIKLADDTALHIFYYYIDYDHHPNANDSVYPLVIRRCDYKIDTLQRLRWRVVIN